MPPGYRPLQIPAAMQAPPPGVFDQQAITFSDAEKAQAILRAQELANQSNQISVQTKQQTFDDDQKLREALVAKYGTGTESFNPDDALQVAQGLAAQTGNLDSMLAIERAQKERRGDSNVPLTATQRQLVQSQTGLEVPEGVTAKDLMTVAGLQKANTYAKSVNETVDKRSDQIQSSAPGGFEADIDSSTGQGPTNDDGKKFTATVRAHSRINNDLDMLEESLRKSGGNDPSDPEFQRQRAILGDISIALKEKNGFGAALTPNEERLNSSSLPTILSRSDVGAAGAMVAAGLGRDPFDAVNTMRALLSTDFDQQATIYKFRPKGNSRGLPAAQSGQSFRIPKAGYGDTSFVAAPTPTPAPMPNGGANDDEAAYKEQYKARLRAQRGA